MSNDISKNENTVRFFVTGDNHFCKKYDGRLSEAREKLHHFRLESFRRMVDKANEECDFFIVTGDLFDRAEKIDPRDVKDIVGILSSFKGTVIVIPGNHDYYDEDDLGDSVWKTFMSGLPDNIILANEFKPLRMGSCGNNKVVFYPAYCQIDQSKTNNLGWIKESEIDLKDTINIGIAHGTIEHVSCDSEGVYFYMFEKELKDIPVDAWFIGHAHIQVPKIKNYDEYTDPRENVKIFNAGTHQQIDISMKGGDSLIVEIEKSGDKASVRAKKWHSGLVSFYDLKVDVDATGENALKEAIDKKLAGLDKEHSVIRLNFNGTVESSEYADRAAIFDKATEGFLFVYPPVWSDLLEKITSEKLDQFNDTGFASKFLDMLADDPNKEAELNMAYHLIKSIQKDN
ncbi:MAG: metallophosphoesterase [Clostridiales bacterium]|nr:metallophosphoesterase [Clostridiales bacterium]